MGVKELVLVLSLLKGSELCMCQLFYFGHVRILNTVESRYITDQSVMMEIHTETIFKSFNKFFFVFYIGNNRILSYIR